MTLALKSLIDWQTHPRRIVAKNDFVIVAGDSADTLFHIESGTARTSDGCCFSAGDFILLCETLALDFHKLSVKATAPCELICLPLSILEATLSTQSHLAWPLSRSIAADMMQRRLAS